MHRLRRGKITAFLVAGLLLLPSLGGSQSPPPSLAAQREHMKGFVDNGRAAELFSENVKRLRACLATYGPSSVETTMALYDITDAVAGLIDTELAAAMWELTRLAASENLPACDQVAIEAQFECSRFRRRLTGQGQGLLAAAADAISVLDPSVPQQRAAIGTVSAHVALSWWRRDLPRSIDMLEAAVELMRDDPGTPLVYCGYRIWLGWTLLQAGRHEEAQYALQVARDEMERLQVREPSLVGLLESTSGDLAVLSNDWATAEACYRLAVAAHVQSRRVSSSRFSERPLEGYQQIAIAQLKRGQGEEAWCSLQRYRGLMDKRLRSLNQLSVRAPKIYARVSALRKRIDSNRSLRRQVNQPQTLREVDWARVLDELEANAELIKLEAAYYAPEVEKTVSLAELQSTLPDNYAYVGWLNCRIGDALLVSTEQILDACWIYVVRSHGSIRWIKLWENTSRSAQENLRRPVGDYGGKMAAAAGWTFRLPPDEALTVLAKAIAEQEFDPVLPLLDGVDHLIVEFFEDRAAWKPLEALVLPDGAYVGDRFEVSYTPTADAFVACRKGRKTAGTKVLVVSDPIFDSNAVPATSPLLNWRDAGRAQEAELAVQRAASNGDLESLEKLPRLRYAKLETDCLKRIFPTCSVLSGVDATEANVRRALQGRRGSSFSVLHFATHALGNPYISQRQALALSARGADGSPPNDGLLDGLEIQLEWSLKADLVTLSGCRTLEGAYWVRGEPNGLAGMMLGAGARSVLATSWTVDDLAAARLNVRFYENLTGHYEGNPDGRNGKPMTKAAALSEAKQWLRNYTDENGKKPFAHPIYWSGFVLLGDPE